MIEVEKIYNQDTESDISEESEGPDKALFENGYDFGDMEEIVSTYDVGTNRGHFIANNIDFSIRPICTDEFDGYFQTLTRTQMFKEEKTPNELSIALTAMFSDVAKLEEEKLNDKKWYKRLYYKIFFLLYKDHKRYKKYPRGEELAKWIEKLVSVNGKKVTLYDLEIKYRLTKDEIARMIIYINKMSGFM